MLSSRIPNAKKSEKEEQRREKEPNDDEGAEVSEKMATSDVEDPGPTTADDTNDVDGDENADANERTNGETKARRSSRKRKQRLTIKTDEIGDCDDENDPDYKS